VGITVVLDTNIFLNVKNREEPYLEPSRRVLDAVDEGKLRAVVSVISIAELCSGYYSAGDERGKQELIMHLVSECAKSSNLLADRLSNAGSAP